MLCYITFFNLLLVLIFLLTNVSTYKSYNSFQTFNLSTSVTILTRANYGKGSVTGSSYPSRRWAIKWKSSPISLSSPFFNIAIPRPRRFSREKSGKTLTDRQEEEYRRDSSSLSKPRLFLPHLFHVPFLFPFYSTPRADKQTMSGAAPLLARHRTHNVL